MGEDEEGKGLEESCGTAGDGRTSGWELLKGEEAMSVLYGMLVYK